jgi:hypothetical protein
VPTSPRPATWVVMSENYINGWTVDCQLGTATWRRESVQDGSQGYAYDKGDPCPAGQITEGSDCNSDGARNIYPANNGVAEADADMECRELSEFQTGT